jgi:hypothetical protein
MEKRKIPSQEKGREGGLKVGYFDFFSLLLMIN